MKATKRWGGRATTAAALTTAAVLALGGVAHADNIQDSIEGTNNPVTLVAGSTTAGTASIRLVGNNNDSIAGCNVDRGPLLLDIVTPDGVTADKDPLSITSCGTDYIVRFTASSSAQSGPVTVRYVSGPDTAADYKNQVSIPITVIPSNTKPSVTVTGVADQASYEIGSVPVAGCAVSDVEDGASTPDAVMTGTLSHGLGSLTATCNYTDAGGLSADTASATYTIVDTGKPTIGHTLSPSAANANGWYDQDVTVSFTCADSGSGIQSCSDDTTLGEGADQSVTGMATDWAGHTATDTVSGINIDKTNPTIDVTLSSDGTRNTAGWYNHDVTVSVACDDSGSGIDSCAGGTTLGEGAAQSVTGTATDLAGNTTTDTVSGINIDKTGPIVSLSGGTTSSYYGTNLAAPTCEASDALSGLASCVVTDDGTDVGAHTFTATATDKAGNTTTARLDYTVQAWTLKGFYSPVDMNGVWNTVKGGSTVPLKFEAFAGSELTSTTAVKSFSQKAVTCPGASAATDDIEFVTTGGTALRYDSTGGQFIQNWATPKKPGTCWSVTMTTQDGSSTSANFILK